MVKSKGKNCIKDRAQADWCPPCRAKKGEPCKWRAPRAPVALAEGRYDDSERVRLGIQFVTKPEKKRIRGLQAQREFKNGMHLFKTISVLAATTPLKIPFHSTFLCPGELVANWQVYGVADDGPKPKNLSPYNLELSKNEVVWVYDPSTFGTQAKEMANFANYVPSEKEVCA